MTKIEEHQYAEEFLEELTIYDAVMKITRMAHSFTINIAKLQSGKKRPLWEWISYFLDWTEYSDFMEWKAEVEKNNEEN